MVVAKNEYLIQHKIRTVASLPLKYCFRGIDFSPYDPTNQDCEYWIATKSQAGENFREALDTFVQELIGITDALSVVCHCSFSLLGTTYLVYKLNSGSQPFFAHVAEIEPTGTVSVFTSKYLADLEKLTSADYKAALHFLRESNNGQAAITRLAMTICAAEALAGTGETQGKCSKCGHEYSYDSTNKGELRQIVGDEYQRLYEKKGGAFRHKLFHGSGISQQEAVKLLENVTQAILNYLRGKLDLEGVPRSNVLAPSFTRIKDWEDFLKPVNEGSFDLKKIEESWNNSSVFTIIRPEPEGY